MKWGDFMYENYKLIFDDVLADIKDIKSLQDINEINHIDFDAREYLKAIRKEVIIDIHNKLYYGIIFL